MLLVLCCIFFIAFASLAMCLQLPVVSANEPQVSIEEANLAVRNAFVAVLAAEESGKNITALLTELNDAALLLAEAENSYTGGSFVDIASKTEAASQIAQRVKYNAESMVSDTGFYLNSFWVAVIFSTGGSLVFSSVLLLVWRRFKQSLPKRTLKLENYRQIFIIVGLVGILLFALPALNILRSPATESFSSIHILGPDHMTNTIPFTIQPNTLYSTFLGVENHLGFTANYVCLVKLTNDTDILPDSKLGTPSPLPTLYRFNMFLQDGQRWETPLEFQLSPVRLSSNTVALETITFNGVDFSTNKPSQCDSTSSEHYYGILVELWAFNESTDNMQYQNRFVHFYLNLAPE